MGKFTILRPLFFVIGLSSSQTLLAASCDYRLVSEWSTGFTAEVTIVNDSSTPVEGWSVSWSYTDGSTVPRTWDANLIGNDPYVASNMPYNAVITANSSTSFGFNGDKAIQGLAAEIPELGGICVPQTPTNQAPIAQISADPIQGNSPLTVNFNANGSSDLDNDVLSYLWDFGNGDVSTDAIATRTFEEAGTYSVSLTVNDGQVDSNAVFTSIIVRDETIEPKAYVLDSENSSLYFVSSKQTHVVESHHFTDLYGSISASGEANLGINLSSAETGIAVRNQRVRDLLFEVETFSEALVSLPVNLASLAAQDIGSTRTESISATLNLHGISAAVDTEVTITKLSDSNIVVQNVSPILINAGDYDLARGVDALREIANLNTISYAVPVNFTLLFNTPQAR